MAHAARRPGGKRARPSAQLPHGLHEPDQSVPLLEHELSRGTSHVPAGALSCLAEAARGVKDDMPTPYPSLLAAWREIIPTVLRQVKDPAYHVKRDLPEAASSEEGTWASDAEPDAEGWIEVCAAADLGPRRRHPLRSRPQNIRPLSATT